MRAGAVALHGLSQLSTARNCVGRDEGPISLSAVHVVILSLLAGQQLALKHLLEHTV